MGFEGRPSPICWWPVRVDEVVESGICVVVDGVSVEGLVDQCLSLLSVRAPTCLVALLALGPDEAVAVVRAWHLRRWVLRIVPEIDVGRSDLRALTVLANQSGAALDASVVHRLGGRPFSPLALGTRPRREGGA